MEGKTILTTHHIELAENYCTAYHKGQFRRASNQPYETHPYAVREILTRYGYDDLITQCVALLHDTVEDTVLRLEEIADRFGFEVSNGVYILSRNKGKNLQAVELSAEEYKQRLLFARPMIQRVKIADMIDNTRTLEQLRPTGIERKLCEAEQFYIPLGLRVAPLMVQELVRNIEQYQEKRVGYAGV